MWEELVSSAIVGSANKQPRLDGQSQSLSEMLGGLDSADSEGLLLAAAGAMSIWRAAGGRLQHSDKPLPEPCEADTLHQLGRRTSVYLGLLLQGEYKELLPECLEAIAAKGKRVGPELLPALLDITSRDAELSRLAAAIQGRRGDWLAQKQPKWRSSAAAVADEEVWETGAKADRLAFLSGLRRTDPARARELLASTWMDEPSKDRTAFLNALATGIGADDEAFLEGALSDKSIDVRREATSLLSQLPVSRLSSAITQIAFSILNVKKRLIGKPKLEESIPEDLPNKLKQARVEFTPVPNSHQFKSLGGDKGRLLYQIVAAVPPKRWSERFSVSPEDFIAAAMDSYWDNSLLGGLTAAAGRFPDPEWNEALLKRYLSRWADKSDLPPFPPEAIKAVPHQKAEALIAECLKNTPASTDHPGIWLLSAYDQTWSEPIVRSVTQSLKKCVAAVETNAGGTAELLRVLRSRLTFIPPNAVAELCSVLNTDFSKARWLEKQADGLISILSFRRDMLSAIESEV